MGSAISASNLASAPPHLAGCAVCDDLGDPVQGPGFMRLIVSLLCAGWGMVFSLGVNDAAKLGGLHQGMPAYWILHAGLLAVTGTVFVLLGAPLLQAMLRQLKHGRLTVEALFVLTASGALVGSILSTLTAQGAVYYEVVAFTLTIYSVGRLVAARTRQAVLAETERTRQQYGRAKLILANGDTTDVAVTSLRPGDLVAIAPGALITVDGEIVSGRSDVRETPLTGEPVPVLRGPGERVYAGSHALDGALCVRVITANARRLDAILQSVESARVRPSQLQVRADGVSRWFVPIIAGISLATFLGWWPAVGWTMALFHAMSVLLVACPCALGLATPVAVFSGLHGLARLGLIARSGDFLDALARCNAMAFDKTGTLSLANLTLREWTVYPTSPYPAPFIVAAVRAAESGNPHPAAKALMAITTEAGEPPLTRVEARLIPGQGVVAQLRDPGGILHEVAIGNRALVPPAPKERPVADVGAFAVGIAINGQTVAQASLGETLRQDAEACLAALAERGIATRILTGDSQPQWTSLSGTRLETGLTPEEKEASVREWSHAGHTVIFVGDGVNDAPAMAHAAAAIAVDGGTDLARATAEGSLVGASLAALPTAVDLARQVHRTVASNLAYALCYNLAGVGLAVAGLLQPVAAVLIMLASSAFVSFRAIRAARLTEESTAKPSFAPDARALSPLRATA